MTTTPKPYVFVLMPFTKEFDDIYQLGIQPACEAAGAYAERVDEQIFEGSILQRVYNQIAKADIIVAEMSGRNPNVFYETGYAHALGKRVVLLTQVASDIPFDLTHYFHIVYEGRIVVLLPELERRIRYLLANPEAPAEAVGAQLSIQVNGVLLTDERTVDIQTPTKGELFQLQIAVNNPAEQDIRTREFELGVITGDMLSNSRVFQQVIVHPQVIALPERKRLHIVPFPFKLLPGAWQAFSIRFDTETFTIERGMVIAMAVRLFTPAGFKDYPFSVRSI